MISDDSLPFKPGGANPMFGNETNDDEWDRVYEDAAQSIDGPQPLGYDADGTQECTDGSTIDPRLLEHLHPTPPDPELSTGPVVDISVDPLHRGQIESSQTDS